MKALGLETDRLILSRLGKKHISETYVGWLNDPNIFKFLETGGNYDLAMLTEYLNAVENGDMLFWAIQIKENLKHIGNIKIDPVNFRHGLGEYGIMMGDASEWGKGYAKEASEVVLKYCFEEVGLRKITLGVVEDNQGAVSLYKKLGFEIEGLYKKHGFYDGRYCNVIRMASFNPGNEE